MNKNIQNKQGQSMVEVVFSIGIVALVITGAVILMLNSLSSQSKRFDYKKATEMGQEVMEGLVSQKNNNPVQFWRLQNVAAQTSMDNYPDYTYTVEYVQDTSGSRCVPSPVSCATATVTITWQRDTTKTLVLTRV